MFKAESEGDWHNRLIWGDNKYVMASLLDEFAGKIDLIYIDPPFATGSDFSVKMEIGDAEWTKAPSAIEDKAYRDTWGRGLDSYLQMMYERLVLIRELLSGNGVTYIHLDWRTIHYVKVMADEVFGINNFMCNIIWKRIASGRKATSKKWLAVDDIMLVYTKEEHAISSQYLPYSEEYKKRFIYEDDNGRYFWDNIGSYSEERLQKLISLGRVKFPDNPTAKPRIKNYLHEGKGVIVDNIWTDISPVNSQAIEDTQYATQKPEALLERIIKASSKEDGFVADFFCGSGTTGAVAEKLGRRWIMADLGRFAIHTTRKRLLGIEGCRPFVVQNLGKYERQYWQGVTFKKRSDEQIPLYEYIQFILKLYNAEPLAGMRHLHGRKGKRIVHIGAVDAPVTFSEIQDAIAETKKTGQNSLDILGWEWEMGLHDVVEKAAKCSGVHLRLFSIPRDVMDQRAVEKGEITFYELAYLEVEASRDKSGRFKVALKDFAIPNLDLIPKEVRSIVKKWSDYIDYWAVDWDWNEDTFHNMWQSYRTRKERKLDLKSDSHAYDTRGRHQIMVKVIDIFGNDTTKVLEVKS